MYREDLPMSAVAAIAEEAARAGWTDVIPMAGGEPRFPAPPAALTALRDATEAELTKYAPFRGTSALLDGIRRKLSDVNGVEVPDEEVIAVPGGAQALFSVLSVLLKDRPEVVLMDPCWEHYPKIVAAAGGTVRTFGSEVDERAHNRIDFDSLARVLSRDTAAVLVNTPLNPTGSVMSADELVQLGDACRRVGATLVVDEEYETFVYAPLSHVTARAVVPDAISLFSMSKSFALTGIRLGYVSAPADVVDALKRFGLYTYMYSASPSMVIASAVLAQDVRPYLADVTAGYEKKSRHFSAQLDLIDGVTCATPEGGLYVLPHIPLDGGGAALRLVREKHLLCVPGDAAGDSTRDHARFFIGMPDDLIAEAVRRVGAFVSGA